MILHEICLISPIKCLKFLLNVIILGGKYYLKKNYRHNLEANIVYYHKILNIIKTKYIVLSFNLRKK